MMNKRIAFLTLFLLAAVSVPASADAQIPGVRLGLGAGPAFPVGHLGEEATTGVHVLGTLGLEVPLLPVGLRVDGLWQRYPDVHEGHFNAMGALVNGTFRVPMAGARPYVVGGIGFMHHEEPETDHGDHAHEGESGTDFAFGVGAGLEIRLLGLGGFIEARYLDWGQGNRAVPLTVGVRF
jgi:opacity protein-like surface antigen